MDDMYMDNIPCILQTQEDKDDIDMDDMPSFCRHRPIWMVWMWMICPHTAHLGRYGCLELHKARIWIFAGTKFRQI